MTLYRFYYQVIGFGTSVLNYFLKKFCATAPILLYHRIASVSNDPIGLCVTPSSFEKHLIFLKENYNILPLSKLSERITNGTLEGNEAAITFDDGYQDNFKNALPLLEKYSIPATIFITTAMLGQKAGFEWDKEYSEIDRGTFLSVQEIQALAKHPLIEIGAHTDTHVRLSNLSKAEQLIEILKSKNIIEDIIEVKIGAFAYPFGRIHDYNQMSKQALQQSGFTYGYSNIQSFARHTKQRYSIPRLNIRECNTDVLSAQLKIDSK